MKIRKNSTEKTAAQASPWNLFGWATGGMGYGDQCFGNSGLWKALRGSGADDGDSPYETPLPTLPGAVGVGSLDNLDAIAMCGWLVPYTLPKYRVMARHPTLALAEQSLVLAILSAETSIVLDEDLNEDAVAQKGRDILQREILDCRQRLFRSALQMLRYGWKTLEVVYGGKASPDHGEYVGVVKFKELSGENVQFRTDGKGALLGIRCNGTDIDAPYFQNFVHGKEDDNYFGFSRYENARRVWANYYRVEDLILTLTKKAAGMAAYVGVPADDPDDPRVQEAIAAGKPTPNQAMGQKIIQRLSRADGVVYTNTAGIDSQDLRTNPDLANGKLVNVEFMEIGNPGPAIASLMALLSYYDKLLLRAFGTPERAAIEATSGGSRADSESHGEQTASDAEATHESIVEQLNEGVVAALIRENCGPQYVGRIRLSAAAIQDDRRQTLIEFFNLCMTDPAFRAGVVKAMGSEGVEGLISKMALDIKIEPGSFKYEPAAPPAAGPSAGKPDKPDDKSNLSAALELDDIDDLLGKPPLAA